MLKSWSDENIERIKILVNTYADDGHYAVFDADGTLWNHDLSESLVAYMNHIDLLSIDYLPENLLPLQVATNESLFSYYLRLCDADISLGYFWLCQILGGFSLGELKSLIDDLFIRDEPVPYNKLRSDGSIETCHIHSPNVFRWQQELISFLNENGITVYVVTASQEELVRMVVCDTKYGLNIASQNVIGMRLALRTSSNDRLLSQAEKVLDEAYYASIMTPSLAGLTTWYSGKVAAIRTYIEPAKQPVLAAGNSESDFEMLHYASSMPGIRLLASESEQQQESLIAKIKVLKRNGNTATKAEEDLPGDGWMFVVDC